MEKKSDKKRHQKQLTLMTSKKDSKNGKKKQVPHHPIDILDTIKPYWLQTAEVGTIRINLRAKPYGKSLLP